MKRGRKPGFQHTAEMRVKIRDGVLSANVEKRRAEAAECAMLFRRLLHLSGTLRPGTEDYRLAHRALRKALADGKFSDIEYKTLKRYEAALAAGRRIGRS